MYQTPAVSASDIYALLVVSLGVLFEMRLCAVLSLDMYPVAA